jgi:hypothetical protein
MINNDSDYRLMKSSTPFWIFSRHVGRSNHLLAHFAMTTTSMWYTMVHSASGYAATVIPDIKAAWSSLWTRTYLVKYFTCGHDLMNCQLWTDILGKSVINVICNQEGCRETRREFFEWRERRNSECRRKNTAFSGGSSTPRYWLEPIALLMGVKRLWENNSLTRNPEHMY